MLKFGIIAEGPTDQTIIENILLGYFEDHEDSLDITYVQPPRPLTETPAGWGKVFKCLERKDHEGALQYNDYLVIHIDTDVQEEPGFDVAKREGGKELSVSDRVDRVTSRLKQGIDDGFYQANAHRIFFAIAVEAIECWLLPLLYRDKKAAKITGCLETANRSLRRANQDALSAGPNKYIVAYEIASSAYRKRRTLIGVYKNNPSLELFIKQLNEVPRELNVDDSNAPQESGNSATAALLSQKSTADDQHK